MRAFVEYLIANNRDIGTRRFSAYAEHGRQWFIDEVCRLQTFQSVCGNATGPTIWNELPPDYLSRARSIVDCVDRYAAVLDQWKDRDPEIRIRVREWTRQHCPAYLWVRGSSSGPLSRFVDGLMAAVRTALPTYLTTFDPELFIWMVPVLRRRVVDEWAKRITPPDRRQLLACATALLGVLREYGIDAGGAVPLTVTDGSSADPLRTIDSRVAEEIADAALFALVRDGTDQDLERSTVAAVRNEVKIRSLLRWDVVDPLRDDADHVAMAKARKLLSVFVEHTNPHVAIAQPRPPRGEPPDWLLRALVARYGSVSQGIRRLDDIRRSIDLELPMPDASRAERDAVIDRRAEEALIADCVPQRADPNAPWHLHGINEREAVALWLGWRRNTALSASGVWRFYEDLLEEGTTHEAYKLPDIITDLFQPRPHDGDEQSYVDACRVMIAAYAHCPGLKLPMALDEAQRRLAWMFGDHPPPPTSGDSLLVRQLASALEVDVGPREDALVAARDLLRAVLYARRGVVQEGDTAKVAAWVTGTLVGDNRTDPAELAPRLIGSPREVRQATNEVHQLWLKGTNTLKHKYLSRVFAAIDAASVVESA